MKDILLTGLAGTNPLAYLAALGVLRVMDDVVERQHPTLRWNPESWHPFLAVEGVSSSDELVEILLERLRRKPGPDARHTVEAKKVFEQAQAEARRKRREIKNRRLPRSEARAAQEAELRPLQERADRFRQAWRARLKECTGPSRLPWCKSDGWRS